jgi:hypothetical protein
MKPPMEFHSRLANGIETIGGATLVSLQHRHVTLTRSRTLLPPPSCAISRFKSFGERVTLPAMLPSARERAI